MLLVAQNIVKQYTGHRALDNVCISIPENTVYGLLGPNGAGKTTFIRIINGITLPDSGSILFKGRPLQAEDVRRMGYLPEERGLYKKMKAGEQALYFARLKGLSKEEALKRLKQWFEKFGLSSRWNRPIEELSKGMQQKLQFIVTVVHEPELLIFDEPFSGFDPLNADLLKQEILDLKQKGATIVFSTHNMLSVEELCDNISLINNAKVVLEGNVEEIRRKHRQPVFYIRTSAVEVNIPENEFFQIVSIEKENETTKLKIRSNKNLSNNALLEKILPYCPILSFEEELPGMNEIFIKTVKNNSNNV